MRPAAAVRVTSTRVMSRRYVSTTRDARTRARDGGRADRVSSRVSSRARTHERTNERSISSGTDRTHQSSRPLDRRRRAMPTNARLTTTRAISRLLFTRSQTARGSAIDAAGWVRTKRRSRPSRRSGRRTRAPVRKRSSRTGERWTPAATDGGGSGESVATGERGDGPEGRGGARARARRRRRRRRRAADTRASSRVRILARDARRGARRRKRYLRLPRKEVECSARDRRRTVNPREAEARRRRRRRTRRRRRVRTARLRVRTAPLRVRTAAVRALRTAHLRVHRCEVHLRVRSAAIPRR